MINTVKKLFATDTLTRLEARRSDLVAELAELENNADFLALLRGEAIRKEVIQKRVALLNLNDELRREAEAAKPPMDPRVVTALRWCDMEKIRAGKELSTRGMLERSIFGGTTAYLETNEPRIKGYVAALDKAIIELKALEGSPAEGIEGKISKIQSAVGHLDTRVERIKTSPAIAGSLQG